MHQMATKQQQLLEEAAFISVQVPCEKVMEAARDDDESAVLQGYLIKQGAGGSTFNPLGRRNWKQRYFILSGDTLIYAKTKDEYERGKIIKELCVAGCRIELAQDAGEGFDICPSGAKKNHVFEHQRGLFDKNAKRKTTLSDHGRVFRLRATTIDERDKWVQRLRQCAAAAPS